jgi:tight adherence protein B
MPLYIIVLITFGVFLTLAVGYGLIRLLSGALSAAGMRERLDNYALLPQAFQARDIRRRQQNINRFRMRLNSLLSMLTSEELNLQLLSANWPITETEFILIKFWGTVGGFGLGWLFGGSIIPGIGLSVLGFLAPTILLNRAILNRRMAFEKQLVDVLVLLTGAVQAGYSFQQALDFVIKEMSEPASDEFKRVQYEVGLGLPLSQALTNLTVRMQNDDLYLLVSAININAQVGGNMVAMMKAVTQTIRERIRLFSEVRALTAQQRFNSYILSMLPVAFTALIFIISPNYISVLFKFDIWTCIPAGAILLTILGNIIMRKVSKIEV